MRNNAPTDIEDVRGGGLNANKIKKVEEPNKNKKFNLNETDNTAKKEKKKSKCC